MHLIQFYLFFVAYYLVFVKSTPLSDILTLPFETEVLGIFYVCQRLMHPVIITRHCISQ